MEEKYILMIGTACSENQMASCSFTNDYLRLLPHLGVSGVSWKLDVAGREKIIIICTI